MGKQISSGFLIGSYNHYGSHDQPTQGDPAAKQQNRGDVLQELEDEIEHPTTNIDMKLLGLHQTFMINLVE